MISLIKNKGSVLEPSYGNGSFRKIKEIFDNYTLIELDENIINDEEVRCLDFFDYSVDNKFDTIIGNPPYVDNSEILESTYNKLNFDIIPKGGNLYLHFIYKSFLHLKENGELIFIVPRDFIKLKSSRILNKILFKNGTITHFFEFGDKKIFKDVSPNVVIFRYEKGNFSYKTETNDGLKNFIVYDGIIYFLDDNKYSDKKLGDLFEIKVGAVSGKDKLFERENGEQFVYSRTNTDNSLKTMIYNKIDDRLLENKQELLNRKIKKFDESNWWEWGRNVNFREDRERIYVNSKTRNINPFFLNSCTKWDGSILALFPKKNIDLQNTVKVLNNIDWNNYGFVVSGRYIFSQSSLENLILSDDIWNNLMS